MKTCCWISLLVILCCGCSALSGPALEERADFKQHFDAYGVKGTLLIYDQNADRFLVHNARRARKGFIPASTYKVFNSLVALETGVIVDENEVLPWDGVERGWDQWDRDHSLRSAIQYSTVWFYQEMARRIGTERMQHYVNAAGYGNRDISGGIDLFWLEGGLRISAHQQIDLLRRLYRDDLPFSQRTLDIVKDILVVEQTDDYVLRAKTGWGARFTPQVGWWVGYLEQHDNVYFFAINIDIHQDEDAKARQAVTRAVLQSLGLL